MASNPFCACTRHLTALAFAVAATTLALPAAGQTPLPSTLTLIDSSVLVELRGNSGALTLVQVNPSFTQLSDLTVLGSIFGLADLHGSPQGAVLRASAAASGGGYQVSRPSFAATFQNTGLAPITFQLGAIKANITASFQHTAGGGLDGVWGNQFSAYFSNNVQGAASTISANFGQRFTGPVTGGVTPGAIGGFTTALNSGGVDGLDVTMTFPVTTVGPGSLLTLALALDDFAFGDGPAWSALTDASNSAYLTMQLPPGVTLISSVPLPWVTTSVTPIPEPETYALMLAGLICMGWFARRRKGAYRLASSYAGSSIALPVLSNGEWAQDKDCAAGQ